MPGAAPVSTLCSVGRKCLARTVEEIRADIDARHRLHEEVVVSIDEDIRRLKLDRGYLNNWAAGCEPSVESRKSALDREIAGLREALIRESVGYWHDITALHKDLREALDAEQMAGTRESSGGGGRP